ncbi:hypothetical protein BKA62DRAFT_769962 [Auriculariales sp. MPI-PUGE-AT-0066]|nr:hypothetical protein BKA62DRAFT_769962 [Auriculariales sp. MPI-PUGE-AT-0066]
MKFVVLTLALLGAVAAVPAAIIDPCPRGVVCADLSAVEPIIDPCPEGVVCVGRRARPSKPIVDPCPKAVFPLKRM